MGGWSSRATLLTKCDGLGDEQRKARPIPTSDLSLHGLVRHMAETERNLRTHSAARSSHTLDLG